MGHSSIMCWIVWAASPQVQAGDSTHPVPSPGQCEVCSSYTSAVLGGPSYNDEEVLMSRFRGGHYKPHLWYYNLLTFLNEDQEQDEDNEQPELKNESTYDDSYQDTQDIIDSDEEETKPKRPKITHNSSNNLYLEHLQNEEEYLEPEVLEQEQEHVGLPQAYIINNEAEAFGRTIGLQLKELTHMQRILAEKLISDVIFQARLEKLTVDTTIASDD